MLKQLRQESTTRAGSVSDELINDGALLVCSFPGSAQRREHFSQLISENSIVATFVRTWTEPPRDHILTNVATNYRSRRWAEPGNETSVTAQYLFVRAGASLTLPALVPPAVLARFD